jgi:hypothetical protein
MSAVTMKNKWGKSGNNDSINLEEGDLQPGCLVDRLLTGLGQPQIINRVLTLAFPSLNPMWGVVFTACVVFPFLFSTQETTQAVKATPRIS